MSGSVLPIFYGVLHKTSRSFMMSCFIFTPVGHFEFTFVYGVKVSSNFTDLHVAVNFPNIPC